MKKTINNGLVFSLIFIFIVSSLVPIISGATEETKYFSTIKSDDFDSVIHDLMKDAHMPSLVTCIVKNNTQVFVKEYGHSKYYKKINTTIHTAYPIGSVTKSVTAVAIMQLNESGKIDLDKNISEYLPFDLKNPNHSEVNITARMLLAHQSSLADNVRRFNYYFFWLNYSMDNYFSKYFLNEEIWNDYPPGEDVRYCTTNTELLGYIVKRITNQSYEDYCEKNIFEPLNMTNTSFYFSDLVKTRTCGLYIYLTNIFNFPIYFQVPKIDMGVSAGGGLKTTALDLSNYLIMHANGGVYNGVRILEEESVEEIHKAQYPDSYDGNSRHGFGWYSWINKDTGEEFGGHMGGFRGSQALMHLRYSDNVGVIMLWNQNSNFLHKIGISRTQEKEAIREIERKLFEKADEL